MKESTAAFSNFADVESWAETHGIWRLRLALDRRGFDAVSTYLAREWLHRFDRHLTLALAQGVVRTAPPTLGFPVGLT